MCKSDNITFQVHTVQVQYYYTHYTHHITLYIAREAIDHGSNCMFTIFGFGTDVNCLKSDPYFLITSLASTTIMCVKNKDDTSIKRFVYSINFQNATYTLVMQERMSVPDCRQRRRCTSAKSCFLKKIATLKIIIVHCSYELLSLARPLRRCADDHRQQVNQGA